MGEGTAASACKHARSVWNFCSRILCGLSQYIQAHTAVVAAIARAGTVASIARAGTVTFIARAGPVASVAAAVLGVAA